MKKQSEMSLSFLKYKNLEFTRPNLEISQPNFDDPSQTFYKVCTNQVGSQRILKHGYKLFPIKKEQEDLLHFCLSLLQAQAKFPLKYLIHEKQTQKSIEGQKFTEKNVWIETQFLLPDLTTDQSDHSENSVKNYHELRVHNFFTICLVPELKGFKDKRIKWDYMVSPEYKDEKVIEQFQSQVVEKVHEKYLEMCVN